MSPTDPNDVVEFNRQRWEELAQAGVMYSRPALNLDPASARRMVDPEGRLDDPRGRDVLCLAGGGGQQSAAFGLLGARVTVLDICQTQLDRDQEAARHYGLTIRTVRGDMRDLSAFDADCFDLVWHAHSLNFVPDVRPVFDGVARLLRPGGQYRLNLWNPFAHGVHDQGWNGRGYTVVHRYEEGAEIVDADGFWDVLPWQRDGVSSGPGGGPAAPQPVRIRGPREFRHTLGALVNGLADRGLSIEGLWDQHEVAPDARPGEWGHFVAYLPPWLTILARRRASAPA